MSAPAPAEAAPARSSQVDSVRAIAALSILVFHAFAFGGAFAGGRSIRAWLFPLESGVTVFLVISGFLLYRPFVRAHVLGAPAPATFPYAIRRFARIVPAFWVALTISALVLSWDYVLRGNGPLTYYTLGQVYASVPLNHAAIAPAWTLGLELSFYAFLPLWSWAMRRLRPDPAGALRVHTRALACLFGASVLYKIVLVAVGGYNGINPAGFPAFATLPAHLDNFALGMGLALVAVGRENSVGFYERAARLIGDRGLWLCGGTIAAYLVATRTILPTGAGGRFTDLQYGLRIPLYWAIAFGLVAPAAIGVGAKTAVGRLLAARPLVLTGVISYGVYLWHWPVLSYLQAHAQLGAGHIGSYLKWLALSLPLTLALATASWLLIEKPSITAARRTSDRAIRFPADGK